MDSNFSHAISFQSFFSNSSKNELWMGRCGGRDRAHHKYMLNSKHPLKSSVFSYVVLEILVDILSIVLRSCPGTALGRKNFGCSILDSHFSILFSSPFPFAAFLSKTCKTELWMVDLGFLRFSSHFPVKVFFEKMQFPLRMVRSWIPTFLMPFPFKVSFQTAPRMNFGWVDVEEGTGRTTNTRLIPSIPLRKSILS